MKAHRCWITSHSPKTAWFLQKRALVIIHQTVDMLENNPSLFGDRIRKEVLLLGHKIPHLFTWPSSPTTRFRNSFRSSTAHCLSNTVN